MVPQHLRKGAGGRGRPRCPHTGALWAAVKVLGRPRCPHTGALWAAVRITARGRGAGRGAAAPAPLPTHMAIRRRVAAPAPPRPSARGRLPASSVGCGSRRAPPALGGRPCGAGATRAIFRAGRPPTLLPPLRRPLGAPRGGRGGGRRRRGRSARAAPGGFGRPPPLRPARGSVGFPRFG